MAPHRRITSLRAPLLAAPAVRLGSALLLALALLAGCSNDNGAFIPPIDPGTGGTGDSTLFAGFLLTGTASGRLDVAIQSISLAPGLPRSPRLPLAPRTALPTVGAHATLHWSGGNVSLTGAYDFTVDTLYLAGGGRVLRGYLSGSENVGVLSGGATTPSGPGAFMAAHDPTHTWTPWTGPFHSADLADSGSIGFVRADTLLAGMALQSGANAAMSFSGDVSKSGTPKTLFFEGALPSTYDASGSGSLNEGAGTASGVYDFTVFNASYGSTSAGTWSAAPR